MLAVANEKAKEMITTRSGEGKPKKMLPNHKQKTHPSQLSILVTFRYFFRMVSSLLHGVYARAPERASLSSNLMKHIFHTLLTDDFAPQASQTKNEMRFSFFIFVSGRLQTGHLTKFSV